MKNFLFVIFLLTGSVNFFLGVLWYRHRDRLALAVDVLRGRVKYAEGKFSCSREHVEANFVTVKKDDLEAMKRANEELKIARGFIASFKEARASYAEAVRETIGRKEANQ